MKSCEAVVCKKTKYPDHRVPHGRLLGSKTVLSDKKHFAECAH